MFKLTSFRKPVRAPSPKKEIAKIPFLKKSSWHAVSIAKGRQPCEAVKQFNGQRWLSSKAPQLPVKGCDLKLCDCRYRHHEDRRAKPRRETEPPGTSRGPKGENRRLSQKDRRKDEQDPS